MTPDTTLPESLDAPSEARSSRSSRPIRRATLLTWAIVLAIFVAALLMRLYLLHLPFDFDSYDEGVYWQSLRAMSSGGMLYRDIFFSQPPVFLLSLYPVYMAFGQTIWSARLGIVLISLCGFVGIALLGRTLAGRLGMIAGLVLLLADPLYLHASQTLEADGPSIALALLAVGLAFLWFNKPTGRAGLLLAILTSSVLALSILCKLLSVAALAPIGLLALARVWMIWRQPPQARLRASLPLITGVLAFLLTTLLVLLPYSGAFHELWRTVVTFHTDARIAFAYAQNDNLSTVTKALETLLTIGALHGLAMALLRRDWRVLPLLAWLLATVVLLWKQVPLFSHHLVALTPPLMALAVMGIHPTHGLRFKWPARSIFQRVNVPTITTIVALLLLALWALPSLNNTRHYYPSLQARATSDLAHTEQRIVHDLRTFVPPGSLVITDAPFLAAEAGYSTPADLVDTSGVRITSGYLSTAQLTRAATQPEVRAVLIYGSTRLHQLSDFYTWLPHHFRRAAAYSQNEELWVKIG